MIAEGNAGNAVGSDGKPEGIGGQFVGQLMPLDAGGTCDPGGALDATEGTVDTRGIEVDRLAA